MSKLKAEVIKYSKKLNTTNLSALRSGNISIRTKENGVDGFYFRRADSNDFTSEEKETITEILNENGFKVIDFEPWEMEWDGDRAWNASVSFVKKPEDLAVGSMKRLIGWD